MPTYALGDIQGCYDDLRRLLDVIEFDPETDRLWFVGDLVNRGPKSLETLRFVRSLGERAVTVLGNHDLHLLAVSQGIDKRKKKDTLDDVLEASDAEILLDWLRHRPLLHHDAELGYTMVHAGLAPQWDLETARALAREVEDVLQSGEHPELFANMYGDEPIQWSEGLRSWDRIRACINAFTRLRYCDPEGRMALSAKGPPGTQPAGVMPWYEIPGRNSSGLRIVFGHWSTLGYRAEHNVIALDSGCVWGGRMTAVMLDAERPRALSIPCSGAQAPRTVG